MHGPLNVKLHFGCTYCLHMREGHFRGIISQQQELSQSLPFYNVKPHGVIVGL